MPQSRMNDLNESSRQLYISISDGVIPDKFNERDSYKQISLTTDDLSVNPDYLRGFDILPMWGNYADKGNGVCIVLKKGIIEKQCSDIFHSHIIYKNEYNPSMECDSSTTIMEDFFCIKTKKWEYEQEYRIVKRTDIPFDGIDITDAVIAIIYSSLGANRNENPQNTLDYFTLQELCNPLGIPLIYYSVPNVLINTSSLSSNMARIWPIEGLPKDVKIDTYR